MVSVIVPVYNAAPYLTRCLDSIAAQTCGDFETIVIDDGSTDSSGRICDGYGRKDGRFRIIHTENRGFSAARNRGLEEASGDWIYFADADDYVHPRVLEVLLAAVTSGYDVAESGFRTSVSTDREPFEFPEEGSELPPFREIPAEACLRGIFSRKVKESLTQAVLWNKLYARKVLVGLRFEHRIMEDAFFNFEVFRRGPKVVRMDAALYSYHQRPDSYSHRTAPDINAVEHLRHTISLMDRTSGMDPVTRGAALCRTYRKMLTARYMTRKTELSGVARGISDRVLSETRREFFRSRGVPFREKAMFSILWLFPPVHNFVMKRLGN